MKGLRQAVDGTLFKEKKQAAAYVQYDFLCSMKRE